MLYVIQYYKTDKQHIQIAFSVSQFVLVRFKLYLDYFHANQKLYTQQF